MYPTEEHEQRQQPPPHLASRTHAKPHPDDVQSQGKPYSPPPSPAEQRSLTTVTRLLGEYINPTTTPAPKQPLPPPRPSLKSILKTHRVHLKSYLPGPSRPDPTPPRPTPVQVPQKHDQHSERTTPNPHYLHLFQLILSSRHTVIPRP